MCATYPFLFKDEGTLFKLIGNRMKIAYATDRMYVCKFRGRNFFLRRGECET